MNNRLGATLLALAAVVVPVVLLAPVGAPGVARSHGAVIGAAAWCREGLCVIGGVEAGRVRAEDAVLRWNGSLLLRNVTVRSTVGEAGVAARAAPAAELSLKEMPSIPFVRSVDVENLTVEGVPLPPLSGQVLPERELYGEGARVVGDEVDLEFESPWGQTSLRVVPGDEPGQRRLSGRCNCNFEHAALGGKLSGLTVSAEGTLDDRDFKGEVVIEGVRVNVQATIRGLDDATGRFKIDPTPIAQVYSIFEDVVPELRRAELRGTVSATGRFTLNPLSVHVEPTVEGFEVNGLVGDEYRYGTFTWMGRDSEGGHVPVHGGDGTVGWLPLTAMGEFLPMAVVATEDSAFYGHAGYDVEGMMLAAADNTKAGAVVRGGSTLTQQLAKNLFLTGDRTYARKLRELLFAVEMERELGKRRIMELYLNVVEWGPSIHGAEAAAESYFLKAPRGLLPEEAAFLASILRNPRGGWWREYRGGRVNGRRMSAILENMVDLHPTLRREALDRDIRFVPPASE